MVSHSEALGSRMDGLLEDPGVCMVGLNGAPRFSYVWTLEGPTVLAWLGSRRSPVFVWLDS